MGEALNSCEMDLLNEQGKCILIVEDDDGIRQSLQMALDDMGFDTFTAKNGKEALDSLTHIPKPSLILLDLMMPVMNGLEFKDELLKDELHSTIPIIVMTAMRGKVHSIKCKEYLNKPIDLDILMPLVKHHFFRGTYSESEDTDFYNFTDESSGDYQE